jgi:hypothetical protein
MRGLLGVLLILSACTPAPAPAARHELILDITNNREAAVVVRIVPQILDGVGVPAQEDAGVGDGSLRVEPQARRTLRLPVTSESWTLTLNGTPFLRSTDHEFIPGGWTAGRIVVDPEEATSELERSQAAPSN